MLYKYNKKNINNKIRREENLLKRGGWFVCLVGV